MQRADSRRARTPEALVELDGRYARVAVAAAALEAAATGRRPRRRRAGYSTVNSVIIRWVKWGGPSTSSPASGVEPTGIKHTAA